MNRFFKLVVFAGGLAILAWVAVGYVGSHALALSVTALIAAVYLAGAIELYREHFVLSTLHAALKKLSDTPPELSAWLATLHPVLRAPVRARMEGAAAALPAPSLAPYLVGLLVLLGMLGTFLGMVVTLRGTGAALESATDLQAIRASLAAPVKGLGFAFGTSIAGVGASAMLGLLSALGRRDRVWALRELDTRVATTLRPYSLAHRREESFAMMQRQLDLFPALVNSMQGLVQGMEKHASGLNEQLVASQSRLHSEADARYTALARTMEQALNDSVVRAGEVLNNVTQRAVDTTMAGLAQEGKAMHANLRDAVERHLEASSNQQRISVDAVSLAWRDAVAEQRAANAALHESMQRTFDELVGELDRNAHNLVESLADRLEASAGALEQTWSGALARHEDASARARTEFIQAAVLHDRERLDAWTGTLQDHARTLYSDWDAAGRRAALHQQETAAALLDTMNALAASSQAHAREAIAEVERLIEASSEAPRVAGELIAELRQLLAEGVTRDARMVDERHKLMNALDVLVQTVDHNSSEQRAAMDTTLARSTDALERVSQRLTDRMEVEVNELGRLSTDVAAAGSGLVGLGESFREAVHQFKNSNDDLVKRLSGIESALGQTMSRSDEQLAYYVAQAREVVDLSILSQKQIIEELHSLSEQHASAAARL
jgi:hypothetical protein